MQPTKKQPRLHPPSLAQQFFQPANYQPGRLAHVPGQTPLSNRKGAPGNSATLHSTTQKKNRHRTLPASHYSQPIDIRTRYLLASRLSGCSSYLMRLYAIMPPHPFPLRPKYQHPKFCATLDPIQEEEACDDLDSTLSAPPLSSPS
jgi:hypothetical protein